MSTHALPAADLAFWAVRGHGFHNALEADEADGLRLNQEVTVPYEHLGGMDYYRVERIAVNVEDPRGQAVTVVALRHRTSRNLAFGLARGRDNVDLLPAKEAEPQAVAA